MEPALVTPFQGSADRRRSDSPGRSQGVALGCRRCPFGAKRNAQLQRCPLTRPSATLSPRGRGTISGRHPTRRAADRRRRSARSAGSAGTTSRQNDARSVIRHPLQRLAEQPGGAVLVPGHQGHGLLTLLPDLGRGDDGRQRVDPRGVVEQVRGRLAEAQGFLGVRHARRDAHPGADGRNHGRCRRRRSRDRAGSPPRSRATPAGARPRRCRASPAGSRAPLGPAAGPSHSSRPRWRRGSLSARTGPGRAARKSRASPCHGR